MISCILHHLTNIFDKTNSSRCKILVSFIFSLVIFGNIIFTILIHSCVCSLSCLIFLCYNHNYICDYLSLKLSLLQMTSNDSEHVKSVFDRITTWWNMRFFQYLTASFVKVRKWPKIFHCGIACALSFVMVFSMSKFHLSTYCHMQLMVFYIIQLYYLKIISNHRIAHQYFCNDHGKWDGTIDSRFELGLGWLTQKWNDSESTLLLSI